MINNKKRFALYAGIVAAAFLCFAAGGLTTSLLQGHHSFSYALDNGYIGSGSAKMAARDYAEADSMMSMAYANDYAAEEAYEAPAAAAGGLSSAEPITPVDTNRKLIRNVGLSVETTSFDDMLRDIQQTVTAAGGYIENSSISGNSMFREYDRRSANLTARVPSDKLDSFVEHVSANGNITNQWENVEDVTLQYTDVESRKKSLAIEQERLWELLEKADSMDSIIALEERLSEIRYELESYESQLRTYDNKIDYSTVHIDVSEVRVLTPTEPDTFITRIKKGFEANFRDLCEMIVDLTVWFVSSLPSLVLLAVIAAVLIWLIRFLIRKYNKKKSASKEPQNDTSIKS